MVIRAPEYPAFGCVVNDRYDEVDPETAMTGDVAVSAPSVATSVKFTAVPDEVVKLIVHPVYVTTPLMSFELHPERVPRLVGFPVPSAKLRLIGDRSVASGLLPKKTSTTGFTGSDAPEIALVCAVGAMKLNPVGAPPT